MSGVRYGAWHGGPDPLEPPLRHPPSARRDVGDDVLAGMSPRSALNRLMRLGPGGTQRARHRVAASRSQPSPRAAPQPPTGRHARPECVSCSTRCGGRGADGALPDPDDSARMAEAELDALPKDTSRAVRALADYQWRSPESSGEVPADPGPVAQRSAGRPVRRTARRHAVGHSSGSCSGPGDDARAQRHARALTRGGERTRRNGSTTFMREYGSFFRTIPQSQGAGGLLGPAGGRGANVSWTR